MAIFGNLTLRNEDHTTETYFYFNYIWGVLILVPFIISTLLNPVVFIFNYNQPRSAASLLYMMLSASDFLTTLLRPIILSYELLKPGLDSYATGCTTTKIFRGSYKNLFDELSATTTACLAIMRFIAIQFPFYRPRKRIMFSAMVTWTLICVIPVTTYTLLACDNQGDNGVHAKWIRPAQIFLLMDSRNMADIIKITTIKYMITCIIALVASGLTVVAMLRNKKTPNARSRNKGCITILVMNAALIIDVFFIIKDAIPAVFNKATTGHDTLADGSLFVVINGGVFLSAFNPLVIVIFSSQIKDFIRAKLALARRVQPNETRTEAVEMTGLDQPDLGK